MKIAFLFLVINCLFHEQIWQNFFKGHERHYSIYVHSKNDLEKGSWLNQFQQVPRRESTWAITMGAQLSLWKEALKDDENEKFILVSESTIPLQTFDRVYDSIMQDDKSIFNYYQNYHLDPDNKKMYNPKRRVPGVGLEYQMKHHQWVILNRKHVEYILKKCEEVYQPILSDQEHYIGTLLAEARFLNEVRKVQTTYVSWHHPRYISRRYPMLFTTFRNPYQFHLIKVACSEGFYFARKVDRDCDLLPLKELLPALLMQGIGEGNLLNYYKLFIGLVSLLGLAFGFGIIAFLRFLFL